HRRAGGLQQRNSQGFGTPAVVGQPRDPAPQQATFFPGERRRAVREALLTDGAASYGERVEGRQDRTPAGHRRRGERTAGRADAGGEGGVAVGVHVGAAGGERFERRFGGPQPAQPRGQDPQAGLPPRRGGPVGEPGGDGAPGQRVQR